MQGFKMPSFMKGGGGPSPMSQMNNQQRLQALGSAFGGDQQGLDAILSQLGKGGQGGGPVMNAEGQDISAAFGGMPGGGGGAAMGSPMGLLARPQAQPMAAPQSDPMEQAVQQMMASLGASSSLPPVRMPDRPMRRFGFGGR